MERMLLRQHVDPAALIMAFSQTRKLKTVIPLLGLERHPALQGLQHMKPSQLRPLLTKIVYGTALEDAFRSVEEAGAHHERESRKRALSQKKAMMQGRVARGPIALQDVKVRAMHEHVLKVFDSAAYYSVPKRAVVFQSLGEVDTATWKVDHGILCECSVDKKNVLDFPCASC